MSEKLLEYFNGEELAAGVWQGKYADKEEVTPDDMHRRMAKEFAKVEDNYFVEDDENLSDYGKIRERLTEEKIYNFFKDFKHIIPQGSIMSQLGVDSIGSLSNCFVVGQPVDSYGGIFQKEQEMIQLMKRRGGVGIDISTLRPEGTLTTNAAKSSTGAVSFMHRFSNGTREVAQKGRRGALMLSIDIKHPDSMEFIKIKRDLTQVTGANISIKLDAEFMKAVENDTDFILRFPCDLEHVVVKNNTDTKKVLLSEYCKDYEYNSLITLGSLGYIKKIKAKEYWDEIIKSAHNVAEPGLMFWDTMVDYSPDGVYPEFKQVTTNPCFSGDTLISVADGRNVVSIKQLAEESKEFLVYSAYSGRYRGDFSWSTEIKKAVAFKTGTRKLIKLTLSNGDTFRCTPEHLLALPNGSYLEAKNCYNVILEPFYSEQIKSNQRIINSKSSGFNKQSRMIWEYYNGKLENGYEIDHIINNGLDNIENLQLLTSEEHRIKTGKERQDFDNPIHKVINNPIHRYNMSVVATLDKNSMYCGLSNEELIEIGKRVYIKYGKITLPLCRKENPSFPLSFSKNRFNGELSEFKDIVLRLKEYIPVELKDKISKEVEENILEPIYVIKIEEDGIEDVYDLTVEDNHNFFITTSYTNGNANGILVHNCSEIGMQPYDACRLIAVNLFSFVVNPWSKEAYFDYEKFYEVNYEAMRLSDDLIDLEVKHIDRIIAKIKADPEEEEIKYTELKLWNKVKTTALSSRRTGLGVTALGDTLAALGMKYDSDQALSAIESIMQTKMSSELDCTVDLSILRGSFPSWDVNTEYHIEFGDLLQGKNPFYDFILKEFPEQAERMAQYGRRNVSWSTVNGGFTK